MTERLWFQKILGSSLHPQLRYFGRSLDAYADMNDDSIPDVSVGAYGKVVQLWWVRLLVVWKHLSSWILTRVLFGSLRSRGVASVGATATFNPDKINIFNKPCDVSGRKHSCFSSRLCFSAQFRPTTPVGPVGESENLHLRLSLIRPLPISHSKSSKFCREAKVSFTKRKQ